MKTYYRHRGFTMVELLVVIVIISVLSVIGFSLMKNVRASAHRSQCIGKLRQWGIAISGYAAENNGNVVWKNWAAIGWDPARTTPYLPYWTGESVDLEDNEDGGAHAVQLDMRHCPSMPLPKDGGNPSVNYAMIRPSPAVANKNDYALASIQDPSHFMFMIDALPNSGTPIASSGDMTTQVKPLTESGSNLRHNHSVNALLGDFSVRSMTWMDIEKGLKRGQWISLAGPTSSGGGGGR